VVRIAITVGLIEFTFRPR